MAAKNIMNLLQAYLNKLRSEHLPVEGLVLYGSYARGDERRDSDIDVLVLLNSRLNPKEVFEIWSQLDACRVNIDARIETWPVTEQRFETDEVSPLIITARSEGIRIE